MAVPGEMDANRELMVDGNAVAGLLRSIFGTEMTVAPARCAHCGTVSEVGALLAFAQHKPAVVLRCPACENVVMRVSPTPAGTFLDLRGAAYVRLGGERG
jgi:predicted Zn-ribbon and HTH transcriptional regulator